MVPRGVRGALVLTLWAALFVSCLVLSEAKKKKKKKKPSSDLVKQETSMGGFLGLVAIRLLYGLASWAGLGEWASTVLGGALRPPNSDYDDYGDFYKDDYGGGEDDDDYGYFDL